MAFIDSESLTSILGWVSIACWVVVYSPQIYENYSLKSGEGLSVAFVIVWLIGDLCNLVGAVLADLLSTVIILAVYYSLCDIILLCQMYYYRWLTHYQSSSEEENNKHAAVLSPTLTPSSIQNQSFSSERAPLLTDSTPTASSTAQEDANAAEDPRTMMIRYMIALFFVCATGVVAWYVSEMVNKDGSGGRQSRSTAPAWVIQTLGWASAVAYLGARLPQIQKNRKTQCEGLSPALFLFAIVGNVTYAASIVTASQDWDYLVKNGGWLAGSALTVFLDFIVLGQVFYYASRKASRSSTSLE
ncbi:PQ loop repeat-domain-containing protein [Pterulicium gracile]|uniref:PQ loop repeat-domain-containing protein n=1 Tax=Pterulicium gracile TaxID=1884261 RepID=A0A5C3QX77_9AGAR|nr:PQ loop repeat-domain-containing protein [Pterula gracilis]